MPFPHSDNLYSAEESDHESFSEELSPTDGYFGRGQVSANAMVPDPSIEDSKPEAKTLIPPHLLESMGRGSRISNHSSSLPSHSYASAQSASTSVPSHPSYIPTSPVSSRRLDDLFPRRPASMNGPPPAYSPSPEPAFSLTQESSLPSQPSPRSQSSQPSPPSQASQLIPTTYNTFPERHLQRGYLSRREEPESMGNPEELPNESTPLSRESRRRSSPCRDILRKLLLIALVLTVTTTLLATIFRGFKSTPLKDPANPPSSPDSPMPPIGSDGPYCSSAIYHDDMATYEFPMGADLTVMQTTYENDGGHSVNVGIAGEIRLRRLPKDSSNGNQAYITVDVNVSDQNLRVIKTWDHETRILKVATPQYAFGGTQPHCVSLEITAWFPENAELTDLLIEAIHLNLRVAEDIKMSVSGQSKFASLNGHVAFPSVSLLGLGTEFSTPSETSQFIDLDDSGSSSSLAAQVNIPFSSRRIVVETLSGSITGCYPLMDFLGVTSQSGSVKINVFPQPVLPSAPAPAELVVDNIAGSIEVNLPVRGAGYPTYLPPPRNYTTRVNSRSGSIKGSYYLGSISDFRTVAGSIHITTMPVLLAGSADEYGVPPNSFETCTVHGSIKVDVLDPVFITIVPYVDERLERNPYSNPYPPTGDDDPYLIIPPIMDKALFKVDKLEMSREKRLRNLRSTHGSQSGSIRLQYPTVWEGTLHAKTLTSSISASGDGLRIIKEKKGFAFNELLARKGVDGDGEGCYVDMSAVAGSLHFLV